VSLNDDSKAGNGDDDDDDSEADDGDEDDEGEEDDDEDEDDDEQGEESGADDVEEGEEADDAPARKKAKTSGGDGAATAAATTSAVRLDMSEFLTDDDFKRLRKLRLLREIKAKLGNARGAQKKELEAQIEVMQVRYARPFVHAEGAAGREQIRGIACCVQDELDGSEKDEEDDEEEGEGRTNFVDPGAPLCLRSRAPCVLRRRLSRTQSPCFVTCALYALPSLTRASALSASVLQIRCKASASASAR
jgi:hypothetical protein